MAAAQRRVFDRIAKARPGDTVLIEDVDGEPLTGRVQWLVHAGRYVSGVQVHVDADVPYYVPVSEFIEGTARFVD